MVTPDKYSELNTRLDELLITFDRKPSDVRRSIMVGCLFGSDSDEVDRKVKQRSGGKLTSAEYKERGLVVGTAGEISDQISAYSRAGVQRIMLQWLDLDDLDGLKAMAKGILYLQK
jgi:alkanesulfonate monooxygenase SsuD/methylene tetrahydromethanopterin reductase-like flavin-dependent oxidoreductase (luciferase family)